MSGLAPPVLDASIEDNTLEYWRTLCRVIPSARLHDGPDGAWFHTEIPFFPFNQVLRVAYADDQASPAIDDLLRAFRAPGLPFCWNVGPASRPSDLSARIQALGPDRTGGMPAMAIDLSSALDSPALSGGAVIERVGDMPALDRWAAAYRDGFGLPPGFVAALHNAYATIGFDSKAPFRHYVALLRGKPVASATMFCHDGPSPERSRRVASLWHITTLPDARGQGIGAAMTVVPLQDARELGCRTGILYASEMGTPLYQRLGFRELFRLEQFGWGEGL